MIQVDTPMKGEGERDRTGSTQPSSPQIKARKSSLNPAKELTFELKENEGELAHYFEEIKLPSGGRKRVKIHELKSHDTYNSGQLLYPMSMDLCDDDICLNSLNFP